jgi:hypothetical protein
VNLQSGRVTHSNNIPNDSEVPRQHMSEVEYSLDTYRRLTIR